MTVRELPQNHVKRALGEGGIETAQRIVRPELDNDRVCAIRNRPVETAEPAGCRVSGHACVGNRDSGALGFQRGRELRRKCVFQRQSKTGAERIAEHHNGDRPFGCFHRGKLSKHARQCEHNRGYKTLDRGRTPPI